MVAPRLILVLSVLGLSQPAWPVPNDAGNEAVVDSERPVSAQPSDGPGWEPTRNPGSPFEQEPGMGWLLMRTLVVLALVVGLAYLTLNWGLRKLMLPGSVNGAGSSLLTVIERLVIEPKRSLYVVQAAGEYWLLASSEQGFSTVSKLSTEEVERLRREKDEKNQGLSPFLAKLLTGRGPTPPKAS